MNEKDLTGTFMMISRKIFGLQGLYKLFHFCHFIFAINTKKTITIYMSHIIIKNDQNRLFY